MNLEKMKIWYKTNHLKDEDFLFAEKLIRELEGFLQEQHFPTLEDLTEDELDMVIRYLLFTGQNTIPSFVVLMRYYRLIGHHDLFIHLTKYTGAIGVVESILKKLERVIGKERADRIHSDIEIPVLGTDLHDITVFTKEFIEMLEKTLSESEMRRVLADNHHQIPKEAFMQEKIYYEAAPTLEAYLKDLHERKVKELTTFMEEKRVWFEQEITQDVVDYVKSNQEIMSAVLIDDALYITKIPYDTKKFLESDNDDDQAYYLCHCPFAREALRHKEFKISANWCYCSGGFTKFPFDVIFEKDLKIEMLESALRKDGSCRFKIDLSGVDYKK
ncbi:MAG: hypothetical protein C4537_05765 [Acholeplasma sp.]|jgi:hypothetical protein|nr:MAG: hypothetical protein C4537_05765 [Acholeplasma sp.]